jgi:hypothetical protein
VVGVQNLDLQWQGSLSFQSAGLDYDWLSMNCQEMLHCVSVTLGCFTTGLDLVSLTLCLGCSLNTPGISPFFECPEPGHLGVVEFWNLYYVMTWMAEHETHIELL